MTGDFESFELLIERRGYQDYVARVRWSPVGERGSVGVDLSRLDLNMSADGQGGDLSEARTLELTLRDIEAGFGSTELKPQKLGERLFRAVFVRGIAEAYRASLERARSRNADLLIKIRCDEAPALASLPWEALWDPTEKRFLPVARGLPVSDPRKLNKPRAPVRILALLPEPEDSLMLSGEDEWRDIKSQLAGELTLGRVLAEQVEPATLSALDRKLETPCDVLHIVAHGRPGGDGSAGKIQLEAASREPRWVDGHLLSRALEAQEMPRLVVLSSCHGASSAEDDAFDGLAQHLLDRGVPAVVAMRTRISDEACVAFASWLYGLLGDGKSVEGAVVEARRRMAIGEFQDEWTKPVFYVRDSNIKLLENQPTASWLGARPWLSRAGISAAILIAILALAGALGLGQRGVDPSDKREIPSAEDSEIPDKQGRQEGIIKRANESSGQEKPLVKEATGSVVKRGESKNEGDQSPEAPPELLNGAYRGHPRCPPPKILPSLIFQLIEGGPFSGDGSSVVLEEFCIAIREVTFMEWDRLRDDKRQGNRSQKSPVYGITIHDAREYAHALNRGEEGAEFRLPDADQWEYAARAGSKAVYHFGNDVADLVDYGNCGDKEAVIPVGSLLANAWGIHDVHGNVAEWVEWSTRSGSRFSKDVEPGEDGLLYQWALERNKPRVLKMGGAFSSISLNCQFGKERAVQVDHDTNVGVRLVRSPID